MVDSNSGPNPPLPKKPKKTHHPPSTRDSLEHSTSFATTLRSPCTYLHLTLLHPTLMTAAPKSNEVAPNITTPELDTLTARQHLTSALSQYLGLHGTAISIDILKVENRDCWIKFAREDSMAVSQALAAWVGDREGVAWRIRGRASWLGGVIGERGRALFGD